MLGTRYHADGKPSITLTPNQKFWVARFQTEKPDLEDLPCFICHGCDFVRLTEKDRYGFEDHSGVCRQCGNVQQSRYYTDAFLDEFYSNYYRDMYSEVSFEELFSWQCNTVGKGIAEFAREYLEPNSRVLEIGCGAGGILHYFQQQGHNVTGLDLDEHYLEHGRTLGLDLRQVDLDDFKTDERFDFIILNHVLEHFKNPVEKLKKIRALLKPGGLLHVEVPSVHGVKTAHYSNLLTYFQNAHVVHFTRKSFNEALGLAGLREVKGSDVIQSLATPSDTVLPEMDSGFEDVMALLSSFERQYRRYSIWFALKRKCYPRLSRLLGQLGVKSALKRILQKP